jgi:hypothetical protein
VKRKTLLLLWWIIFGNAQVTRERDLADKELRRCSYVVKMGRVSTLVRVAISHLL